MCCLRRTSTPESPAETGLRALNRMRVANGPGNYCRQLKPAIRYAAWHGSHQQNNESQQKSDYQDT
jgi:hypothetical protein